MNLTHLFRICQIDGDSPNLLVRLGRDLAHAGRCLVQMKLISAKYGNIGS